ncbi:uncharacterized protein LOC100835590 [Brachypodium distachyon]|uniref:Uncharacterized protein n=1 Tax=Brachypodium distachyon TaxID=15368 RepID=I1IH82_BRADI|nr:uncharacterized protein LOC100835590 [Brachypodium distachyon]KQJ86184.1 hypothetical protein BRADI_4g03820v3 [Brachypodium distachyon]|eukprot:XP_010237126.1 uncharacterized protein LOC100835590 [Brachypodium distachyon]
MASLLSQTTARPSSSGSGKGRVLLPRVTAMATQSPKSGSGTKRSSGTTTVFPVGKPAGGPAKTTKGSAPVKLLTNVEKLRLLTKAEKAGLLSAAERAGLSLSAVERLGLLSKAEELGVLSAATDPGTPGTLQGLALLLLAAGPAVVFLVPEQYPWEVALQAVVALACVAGGSAAFAASSFVSRLQGTS